MKLFVFFLFFLIFSCLVEAATVADTLSVDTCIGPESFKLYPTRLEQEGCTKLKLSDNFLNMEDPEKKRVIIDMITKGENTLESKHKFVEKWNRKLNFTRTEPDGIPSPNAGPVENIWAATFSVFDTYYDDDKKKMFTQGEGTVHSGYHYNITPLPEDYDNSGKEGCRRSRPAGNPDKWAGQDNCITKYKAGIDTSRFKVSLNGISLNGDTGILAKQNGVRTFYPFAQSSLNYEFKSELDIDYVIVTDEWVWKSYGCDPCKCCKTKKGKSKKNCKKTYKWKCEPKENSDKGGSNEWETPYPYHAEHTYPITIEPYPPRESPNTRITITDRETSPVVKLDTKAPDYKLRMGSASIAQYKNTYRIDWLFPPYNSLHVVRMNGSSTKFVENLKMVDSTDKPIFEIKQEDAKTCSITYYYPLGEKVTEDCTGLIEEKYTPHLEIDTEQWAYEEEDTIKVDVKFSREGPSASELVTVKYCDHPPQTTSGSGTVEFTPDLECDLITAEYSDADFNVKASTPIGIKKSYPFMIMIIISLAFTFMIGKYVWYTYWRESI